MERSALPVAVIGAGPIGLAAAAHLVARGETPLVLEAGSTAGTNVLRWAHVRMFSPWRYNVDPVAAELLAEVGYIPPDGDVPPTGAELYEHYLRPLAGLPRLRPHIRFDTRVIAVHRQGLDKVRSGGRETAPFVLRAVTWDGSHVEFLARAVIDASGVYHRPNPLGGGGVPALGEPECSEGLFYGIPDVLGTDRHRYAGRRVMVVGSGHSALNALLDLAELAGRAPGTRITWVIRRQSPENVFGTGERDALAARARLGARARELLESGRVDLVTGFAATSLHRDESGLLVSGLRNGQALTLPAVDEIIVATGARPDLAMLGELRLDLDPALECPRRLAPLIDPNVHTCGTVPPHGEETLRHPEPGFYVVGIKSYGRAPTFLLLVGYEQVRSVVAAITGDHEAAREVRLTVPGTGACAAGGCCGDPAGERAQAQPETVVARCCG